TDYSTNIKYLEEARRSPSAEEIAERVFAQDQGLPVS
ncbi:unnamed protein product, partial [marine sediment metagenome]